MPPLAASVGLVSRTFGGLGQNGRGRNRNGSRATPLPFRVTPLSGISLNVRSNAPSFGDGLVGGVVDAKRKLPAVGRDRRRRGDGAGAEAQRRLGVSVFSVRTPVPVLVMVTVWPALVVPTF